MTYHDLNVKMGESGRVRLKCPGIAALRQEIRKRDGALAADGVITMVTIDPATRRSRPVPDELAAACRS